MGKIMPEDNLDLRQGPQCPKVGLLAHGLAPISRPGLHVSSVFLDCSNLIPRQHKSAKLAGSSHLWRVFLSAPKYRLKAST